MPLSPKHQHESSSHFEAFFEYATMGIIVANSSGEIAAINPFALREFGYRQEELLGQKIELLIPARYQQNHVQHRDRYNQHPQTRPMGLGMDLFARKKDGTEFPVEISLGNYTNENGRFVIAFVSNITVRKKAEAEIEKLNNDLEATVEQRTRELTAAMQLLQQSKEELSKTLEKEIELGELKSRFVSMASHEFRTPLSTVLSSTYLIEKYVTEADQPKREAHLQRIISSVNLLTDILNDFLSVGRIEEGRIQVRLTSFNIEESIRFIADELRNNLKTGQYIVYSHEGDTEVVLDASLLRHIVMNLISNASKFSPANSSIEIHTSNNKDGLLLTVKDHGMGISAEDQQHLMERFFRGANAGNIQGTGLGLHIVSKYAELMNGTVTCSSELEKGTEFSIFFTKQPNN